MQRIIALAGLLALAVIKGPPAAAAASSVPTFDTRPTCADAAAEISVTRTVERCQRERAAGARCSRVAMEQLFQTRTRQTCVGETRIGGFPSYVQLLTCLEMARDARTLKLD